MVHLHREDGPFTQSAIGEVVSVSQAIQIGLSRHGRERIRSFTSSLITGKQLDMFPSLSIFEG